MANASARQDGAINRVSKLLASDAAGGVVLLAATVLALLFSNTALSSLYDGLLGTKISIAIGTFSIDKPLLLWINDGLMAVFFLLVGLELKREVLEGELSDTKRAALPVMAAIGGIAVPALIYWSLNNHDPEALRGWAVPAATDIAFALGILALLGSRAPVALKVFLLAVAIIDDLAAIIIIAVFYTAELSLTSLVVAGLGVLTLGALNRGGVTRLGPFIIVGAVVWVFLLQSGVHATLAGVVTALFVPHSRQNPGDKHTVLVGTEHELKPWVLLGIMPLFAFANAGVDLRVLPPEALFGTMSIGIAAGLFIGKQLGIMAFSWIAIITGLARLPSSVTWLQLHGVSLLAGIGFTMSLFIGALAFSDPQAAASVRIGVLTGSILSGIAGYLVLRVAISKLEPQNEFKRERHASGSFTKPGPAPAHGG